MPQPGRGFFSTWGFLQHELFFARVAEGSVEVAEVRQDELKASTPTSTRPDGEIFAGRERESEVMLIMFLDV